MESIGSKPVSLSTFMPQTSCYVWGKVKEDHPVVKDLTPTECVPSRRNGRVCMQKVFV